jgi:hypothetical protein
MLFTTPGSVRQRIGVLLAPESSKPEKKIAASTLQPASMRGNYLKGHKPRIDNLFTTR